jgi:hypothetical protein
VIDWACRWRVTRSAAREARNRRGSPPFFPFLRVNPFPPPPSVLSRIPESQRSLSLRDRDQLSVSIRLSSAGLQLAGCEVGLCQESVHVRIERLPLLRNFECVDGLGCLVGLDERTAEAHLVRDCFWFARDDLPQQRYRDVILAAADAYRNLALEIIQFVLALRVGCGRCLEALKFLEFAPRLVCLPETFLSGAVRHRRSAPCRRERRRDPCATVYR